MGCSVSQWMPLGLLLLSRMMSNCSAESGNSLQAKRSHLNILPRKLLLTWSNLRQKVIDSPSTNTWLYMVKDTQRNITAVIRKKQTQVYLQNGQFNAHVKHMDRLKNQIMPINLWVVGWASIYPQLSMTVMTAFFNKKMSLCAKVALRSLSRFASKSSEFVVWTLKSL